MVAVTVTAPSVRFTRALGSAAMVARSFSSWAVLNSVGSVCMVSVLTVVTGYKGSRLLPGKYHTPVDTHRVSHIYKEVIRTHWVIYIG